MSLTFGDALFALNMPYRVAVAQVNHIIQPTLFSLTDHYIQDAIVRHHAENNPRLQHLLRFEIERRGYGAGQTQDVAEPIVWQGIKIAAALSLPPITKALEQIIDGGHSSQLSLLSKGAAAGIILKESLDFFRLVGRYTSGLQGSEQMALIREHAIIKTGVDPFVSATATLQPSSRISSPQTHISPQIMPNTPLKNL
jgi:hypothetical protein